jgi:PhnB protein
MAKVKPIPDGYHSIIPYLILDDASGAIDWYCKALGAQETVRMPMPGGKVGHAELKFGDSIVMLADEFPDMGFKSPKTIGGTSVTIVLYVEDVDAAFDTAVKAGATVLEAVEDKFYGDRAGQIVDPYGHIWNLMTHVEDVPEDEMRKRMEKMTAGG